MSTAALIAAMHTSGGSKGRYVLDWQTLMQRDADLRAAVTAVFGKRLPTVQKLGVWLVAHAGAHGEFYLEARHSRKRKAWAYRVLPVAEMAAKERARQKAEPVLQFDASLSMPPMPAPAPHANRPKPAHGPIDFVTKDGTPVHIPATRDLSLKINVQPLPQYEGTSSVNSDGCVVWEVLRGRDGEPVPKRFAETLEAAPKVAAEPARSSGFAPWMDVNESGTPILKRQPKRAELAARHNALRGGHSGSTLMSSITPGLGSAALSRLWLKDF